MNKQQMLGVMKKRNKTLELHEFTCVFVCIVYSRSYVITKVVPGKSLVNIETPGTHLE